MIQIHEPQETFSINGKEITINPLEVFDKIVGIETEHGIEQRNDKVKELLGVQCSSAIIERVIDTIIDYRTDFIEQGKKKLPAVPQSDIGTQG